MFSLFWDPFVCKVICSQLSFSLPKQHVKDHWLNKYGNADRQTILQNIQRSLRGMEKRTKFVHFVQVRDSMSLV